MSHEQASELLPWLVNNSLAEAERDLVHAHAVSCVVCRRELHELENLRDSIANVSAATEIPAPDMRRINSRIDALIEKESRGQLLLSSIHEFFRSPWRFAFIAQTAVVAVLATVLLWPAADEPAFTTLTNPQALPEGQYVRVVFKPALPASELSSLLDTMNLTIVDGPSDRGVYTLRLSETLTTADREAVVADLSSNESVMFAQPVPGRVQR
jgi:hypothetical protein